MGGKQPGRRFYILFQYSEKLKYMVIFLYIKNKEDYNENS